jgi:7 transmembrane receptor (Secretin family)
VRVDGSLKARPHRTLSSFSRAHRKSHFPDPHHVGEYRLTSFLCLTLLCTRKLEIRYKQKSVLANFKVLITKLRSANTIETRQYRKAAKALLVLIPLLGITYLIVIAGPNEGLQGHLFQILQAFLLSIQGFSVALFYCFFNSEVRQALKHRFNRWNDSRNLSSGNSIRSRRYTASKDYSPRSRTESIR